MEARSDPIQVHPTKSIVTRSLAVIWLALALLVQGQTVAPDMAVEYFNRGRASQSRGGNGVRSAIADYTKAIELRPDYAEAYEYRGLAKSMKGDIKGAIADYTKAIECRPDYTLAYTNRGVAEKREGDVDAAIADFTKAIEIEPTNAAARAFLAAPARQNPAPQNADYAKSIYRAYPAPALPQAQVAVLKLSHVFAKTVDGAKCDLCTVHHSPLAVRRRTQYYCTHASAIELLPGKHTVTFEFGYDPQDPRKIGFGDVRVHDVRPVTMDILLEAGKTYKAQRNWQYSGTVARSPSSSIYGIHWWVDMTELAGK